MTYPTFNLDELRGVAGDIKRTDKLAPTTLDSIVRLGNTAQSALAMHGRLANLIPDLELALEGLAQLANRERYSSVDELKETAYSIRLRFSERFNKNAPSGLR